MPPRKKLGKCSKCRKVGGGVKRKSGRKRVHKTVVQSKKKIKNEQCQFGNVREKNKRVSNLGERIGGCAKKKKIQNEQCQFGQQTMFGKKKE